LPEDLLTAVSQPARAEGRTVDEVIEAATRRYLANERLDWFVRKMRSARESLESRKKTHRVSSKNSDSSSEDAECLPFAGSSTSLTGANHDQIEQDNAILGQYSFIVRELVWIS